MSVKFALRIAAAVAIAAMVSSAATAAVYAPNRQLPAQVITEFKGAPASLLQQFPIGGAQMISRVRDLGASDPSTLPGLIGLLKDSATTKDQMTAIVAGLAQVARMAAQTDQAFATEIQTAIAGTNNPDVIAAYQAATGDVAIAATGGGAGAGGGTGAGGATGTSGFAFGGTNVGANPFGGLHYANSPASYSGSVGGASVSVSPR
ncbi:hypothetical protein [Bradyrhizobium neotropicale]|uniref:hypothetical protein n=1 Tax=Bradyrhizobium neotropicale TaxID=1497615 RepID=UPI001AD6F8B7|nr:hypothetical protein [Bradyrhizobium neotropicale]MBO4227978.1 hypothetical protein [Bradyrhizobium neotropicale]